MGPSSDHDHFLALAIAEAARGVAAQDGGPFGAVVVKDAVVIASGHNRVTSTNDPTAHAEVVAVRAACAALQSFQLEGCDVYASAEPCPMCMGALYWARPRGVYFAATREDAARAGFDDAFIYDELALPIDARKIPVRHVAIPSANEPFELWAKLEGKIRY
jgi:guanine deaminase